MSLDFHHGLLALKDETKPDYFQLAVWPLLHVFDDVLNYTSRRIIDSFLSFPRRPAFTFCVSVISAATTVNMTAIANRMCIRYDNRKSIRGRQLRVGKRIRELT
jgi:hypothetical protein